LINSSQHLGSVEMHGSAKITLMSGFLEPPKVQWLLVVCAACHA
jgi:hypothetical protein